MVLVFNVRDVSDWDACTTACSVNMVLVGGGEVVGDDDVSVVVFTSILDVDVGD